MRETVSISLGKVTRTDLQARAKKRGFQSLSTYVNYLIQTDEDVISEEETLNIIHRSQKEYRDGDVVYAASMADLL